ncbi:MAG: hypothetical protein ACREM8_03500, partial [Vulcanimicrobiaceae bacterium]
HSGAIGRPLVSIVAEADTLITPSANARPYLDAVVAAGAAERYWQFVVADGGHVDNYCAYGYGLVPMFPFAHAAFETLVGIVERGVRPAGAGTARAVARPDEIG